MKKLLFLIFVITFITYGQSTFAFTLTEGWCEKALADAHQSCISLCKNCARHGVTHEGCAKGIAPEAYPAQVKKGKCPPLPAPSSL